jgi:hypothetical protein
LLIQPLSVPLALPVALQIFTTPSFAVELNPVVASGPSKPVYLTHARDGSGRLFVVELDGRVRVVQELRPQTLKVFETFRV